MKLLEKLGGVWKNSSKPFLIDSESSLAFKDIADSRLDHLDEIKPGDSVALVGDFDGQSIANFIELVDRNCVVVPLTRDTSNDHEYFFESASVDWRVEGRRVSQLNPSPASELLSNFRDLGRPGLVLFTTGTTGRPKAILHDLSLFLERYSTPRPTLVTLNFLLFDHIGGINTLLHTLYNGGTVIAISKRTVSNVLELCRKYAVEVLPATPTFLRLLLMSGDLSASVPSSLKVITYGTERMDQGTLNRLCIELPNVDFRQTFGMSELGILRVKSKSRESLYMKIGGDGVKWRTTKDGVLEIFSPTRMVGYLNAESPFSTDGWYNTKDVVEVDGEYIKVVGRTSEIVNVGGLKFATSEVDRVVLEYPGIVLAKTSAFENPVTGQHVELTIQIDSLGSFDLDDFRLYLNRALQKHMRPRRIHIEDVKVGHRFKLS